MRNFSQHNPFRILIIGFFLLMVPITLAGLSRFTITGLHAQSTNSYETENGVRSGNIALASDPNASGGEYVLFGNTFAPVTLQDTNYSIPSGAYYVSPTGSDSNSGTLAVPFQTLTKAISVAPSGSTIVMRSGTYREAPGTFYKALTIQPYPHEQVWIKGSIVVSGFVQSGSAWEKDNWQYRISNICPAQDIDTTNHPLSCYPDQVFYDGTPLTQIATPSAVTTGTFAVDYTNSKLYIGNNPTGHTVEATVYGTALSVASGSTIRGLGFEHFASRTVNSDGTIPTSNLDSGAVAVFASNVTLENNTFAYNALNGVDMYGSSTTPATNNVVRGNTFIYNGKVGLQASGLIDGILIEKNQILSNAYLGWQNWSAAGAKILNVHGAIIRDNTIENNQAQGLWCDGSCYNVTIVRNTIENNAMGIMYEISANAIIASNVVANNASNGIFISGSSQVKIYNNTMVNQPRNLNIWQDPRTNTDATEISLGITWLIKDIAMYNNIISGFTPPPTAPDYVGMLLVEDPNDQKSGDQMVSGDDNNAFYRKVSTSPTNLIRWSIGGLAGYDNTAYYTTLASFQSAHSGHEVHSISIDNQATNPFFVNEGGGDYRLLSTSPAVNAGAPLPQDVTNAINSGLSTPLVTAGTPVNMGALNL